MDMDVMPDTAGDAIFFAGRNVLHMIDRNIYGFSYLLFERSIFEIPNSIQIRSGYLIGSCTSNVYRKLAHSPSNKLTPTMKNLQSNTSLNLIFMTYFSIN